jgi:hypothetical protein
MTIKAFFITHSSRTFKPKLNFQNGQRETQLTEKTPRITKTPRFRKTLEISVWWREILVIHQKKLVVIRILPASKLQIHQKTNLPA